jgi:RHS repeat-associated protein
VYDGLNPVQEKNGGTVTANLLTGLGIDEFFTRTDGVGSRALLTDALGSTVALGDNTGTLQTQYTYEPFGYATQTGQANTNSYKYTGREDDGSGLYYYRARYYHPRLQRFISEDPLGIGADDLNFYAYARNTPTILIDPLGEAGQKGGRGRASGPAGSPNAFKHMKPDPTDPSKVIFNDPDTGKKVQKAKPPGFDEYWRKKHGPLPFIRCLGALLIVDPDAVMCAINPMLCPCTDETCT